MGLLFALAAVLATAAGQRPAEKATVDSLNKIWDRAPHNAFTDLVLYKGRWYCVFREGQSHVSPDGSIRVLTSSDGEVWSSVSRITMWNADLRDPKLTVTPDDRLVINAAAAYPPLSPARHQTFAWSSTDGREWSAPVKIGDPDFWLWRMAWHRNFLYAPAYATAGKRLVRMYMSRDGWAFNVHAENIFDAGEPSEAAILFLDDGTGVCLLRRDGKQPSAQLGIGRPPYRGWDWSDLGVQIGGPQILRLPDNRIVAGVRLYQPKPRTALCWLDLEAKTLTEFLALPSGGDNSYPGLVFRDGLLWVSYYSSHEGKASIYLAKVKPGPLSASRAKPIRLRQ